MRSLQPRLFGNDAGAHRLTRRRYRPVIYTPVILQRGASVQTLDREQQSTLEQLDSGAARTDTTSTPPRRTVSVAWVLRWSMALLMLGAAGIHFAAMGEHAGVSWSHGLFFGLTAWAQVMLAGLLVLGPRAGRSRSRSS